MKVLFRSGDYRVIRINSVFSVQCYIKMKDQYYTVSNHFDSDSAINKAKSMILKEATK